MNSEKVLEAIQLKREQEIKEDEEYENNNVISLLSKEASKDKNLNSILKSKNEVTEEQMAKDAGPKQSFAQWFREKHNRLPSFEEHFVGILQPSPDKHIILGHSSTHGCLSIMSNCVEKCRAICKLYGGLLKQDDPKFKEAQKEWWKAYQTIMLVRAFLLRLYSLPMPNWPLEIIEERQYLGVLLSEDDFKKFCVHPESGIISLEPDEIPQTDAEKKVNENEKKED